MVSFSAFFIKLPDFARLFLASSKTAVIDSGLSENNFCNSLLLIFLYFIPPSIVSPDSVDDESLATDAIDRSRPC